MPSVRDRIERVVVLMLENRSFDHMLGFLEHPGLPRLTPAVCNPRDPARPDAERHPVRELAGGADVSVDPGHGYRDVMRQLTGRDEGWDEPGAIRNDGFVWNYAQRLAELLPDGPRGREGEIMGCYPERLVPVLSALAREFAVCSRWFCSLPSETWPNRMFAHAGHSGDLVENEYRLYGDTTIFDRLAGAGHRWKVYAGDIPQVAAYRRLHRFLSDDFATLGDFFEDAREGRLPAYSFVEPKHFGSRANSQHPCQRVWRGERLLHEAYAALSANREVWESLLLIVTYDEHGGFFDREPPPAAIPPRPGHADPAYGFGFDRLGPRVPALVVSPYVEPLTVDAQERDHTAIPRTLRDVFEIPDALSEREAAATPLTGLLTRDEPRPAPELPAPPDETVRVAAEDLGWANPTLWARGVRPDGRIVLNDLQAGLAELARLIDAERAPAEVRGAPAAPPLAAEFTSEEEVERFVEGFRRRHMTAG
jgi:phospholipase C